MKTYWKKESLLLKQPTKHKNLFEAIKRKSKKTLLTKDTPIQIWHKEG